MGCKVFAVMPAPLRGALVGVGFLLSPGYLPPHSHPSPRIRGPTDGVAGSVTRGYQPAALRAAWTFGSLLPAAIQSA